MSNENRIVVVSGPSGSGKSTLIRRLMKKHRDTLFSVSHTTRARRERERDGVDYHFVTRQKFQDMIDRGAFVEWAPVHDHYYGTSLAEIEKKAGGDDYLVLDIDVQGAGNLKKIFPGALYVFVVPPSLEELRRRLARRENGIDGNMKQRLVTAREELKQYSLYDYLVVNDRLEEAVLLLESMFIAFKNKTPNIEPFIKNMIGE